MKRHLTGRPWLLPAAIVVVMAAAAGGALAAFPDDNVAHLTGCLNNGGSFTHVAIGDSPAKDCGQNETLVHLSGGDITAVRTPPGSGLTGGSENGAATLSLAGGFSLPQSCSDQQVPKWNSPSTTWACGNDNNTTYSNGTGLDLSAGNAFSLDSGYRLPQNCANGAVAKSNGNNVWSCQSTVNGVSTFTVSKDFPVGTFSGADNTLDCPAGSVPTGGGYWAGTLSVIQSSPSLSAGIFGGWRVIVSSGFFDNDHYTIQVVCLKTS
jgi:hypothetical protein